MVYHVANFCGQPLVVYQWLKFNLVIKFTINLFKSRTIDCWLNCSWIAIHSCQVDQSNMDNRIQAIQILIVFLNSLKSYQPAVIGNW